MSIRTVQSKDPRTCTIRTYPEDDKPKFIDTIYGPMQLAQLISDLSEQLARMHQLEAEAKKR